MIEPLTIWQKLGYTVGILIPTALIVAMLIAPSFSYETEKKIEWWIHTIVFAPFAALFVFWFCVVPVVCIASMLWMVWFGDKT